MLETNDNFTGSIFHALPGLYLVMAPDLVILDATDTYLHTTLATREDIIGRYFFEVFPNNPATPDLDSAQNFEYSLRYVLEHKQEHIMDVLRYDIPSPTQQGGFEERYWSPRNKPILDRAGNLLYILHEARDITAQILSQREKAHNQERLQMLTGALSAVSWEYDILNDHMSWGKNLQQILGYTPEEIGNKGEGWDKRVHPKDFNAVQQSITMATSSGSKIWTGEYRFRKADGTYIPVLDQGYIVYDAKGTPIRTIGSIIDLTHSKQSEESLRESDERFWHLLEVLPQMAWLADAQGRIVYFNENWFNFTGMPRGQLNGWVNVIHPEDSASVLTAWHDCVRTGDLYEMEYRIKNYLTGEYRWFMERGVPMLDDQGKVKSWIGAFTDIEDQKNALVQVQVKDRQLESILNLSPAHLCLLTGPEHICRYITPGVYRMYGNRHYVGRPAREIWPELHEHSFLEILEQVYHQQDSVTIEQLKIPFDRHHTGKPEEAYFNLQYQPILDQNQETEGILISAIEITELVVCRKDKSN
ncbi:PAS domain-containing protein [Pontibacter oryzae]|uniref:histidine kinase n=1 Tax=Pontibacter oryzae TaxID=2304593 RepID=A0A399S276_9BACT|nr:PAS domain-containing protein [Pontibacter oryzae]RIJ37371.1 PAS domain S-box protein [Pontibacter oryzae]